MRLQTLLTTTTIVAILNNIENNSANNIPNLITLEATGYRDHLKGVPEEL